MKREKSDKKSISSARILLCIFVTFLAIGCIMFGFVMLCIWRDVIPVSRDRFPDYEAYSEEVNENNCFAGEFFLDELPVSASNINYYWHRKFRIMQTAYSMLLEEDDYIEVLEERIAFYKEHDLEWEHKKITYFFEGTDFYYLEDHELYQTEFAYLQEVLHNPHAEQQYYFLVINKFNTSGGTVCYNGVILNDVTREVVEFSAAILEK